MTEKGSTSHYEEVVNGEIVKFHELFDAQRELVDSDLSGEELDGAITEVLTNIQELPSLAGAQEHISDFGNDRVGSHSHAEFTGEDSYRWSMTSVTNVGAGNIYIEGLQMGVLYKYSSSSDRVMPTAPRTHRYLRVLRNGSLTNPHNELTHGFYAAPKDEPPFSHSTKNTRQTIAYAKAFIAEYMAIPKNL